MSVIDAELAALAAKWHARARTYRCEADESGNVRDICRLAGMASSWKFAAHELCDTAVVHLDDGPPVANSEAYGARLEMGIQLAHNANGPQP
jgi:hypothetical protein